MILTVTLNPAIDMSYQLDNFKLDASNRVTMVSKTAGGKGLNVTRVLHQIGDEVLALGFAGGYLGQQICDDLSNLGIANEFTRISGQTRNCISILHDQQQTEILEKGPTITPQEAREFIEQFVQRANQADVIVLSGSLSDGLTSDFYAQLIASVPDKKVILDTSNQTLQASLEANVKPFAIKPNLEELTQFLQQEVTLDNLADILQNHALLQAIDLICVSLGGDGAMVKYKDSLYRVTIPKITVVSPVGSGDSVVAGLASGLERGYAIEEWLQHAMVLGMLNAQEQKTGYVNLENYNLLKQGVMVTQIV